VVNSHSSNSSSNTRELYRSLIGNTDNQYYLNLLDLINKLAGETLEKLVKTTDKDEMLRLQGQARSLQDMHSNLTRKPVDNKQYTGSFS
jgi:hypothetical protein